MDSNMTPEEMAKYILENEDALNDMSLEEIQRYREKLNPLNVEIKTDKQYACLAKIDFRDIFYRRFATTALIGYQSRAIESYEPAAQVARIRSKYAKLFSDASGDALIALEAQCEAEVKSTTRVARQILRDFHISSYQFDPDRHVRAAAIDKNKASTDADDVWTTCAEETLPARDFTVPADMYHNLDRYITAHYDSLRRVTEVLYNEREEVESFLVFYKAFDTEAEATNFIKAHEDDATHNIMCIESGLTNVTMTKKNYEKTQFNNKKTEIIASMDKQREMDAKLGKDLMDKRILKNKKENIAKFGADPKELDSYINTCSTVANYSTKRAMSREEQEEYLTALRKKEEMEAPEDSIQVEVFSTKVGADGEEKFERGVFHTQAEAPIHLEEGSKFATQYQPKRPAGVKLEDMYSRKTVMSREGETKSVLALKEEK